MGRSGDRDIQNVMMLSLRLSAVQEDIRSKQAEELDLKAQIRALLKGADAQDETPVHESAERGDTSLSEAMIALLDATPDVRFTPDAVHAKMKNAGHDHHKVDTVRSSLARLAAAKRVKRPGRGIYQSTLAPELPGLNGETHPSTADDGAEEVGPTH